MAVKQFYAALIWSPEYRAERKAAFRRVLSDLARKKGPVLRVKFSRGRHPLGRTLTADMEVEVGR